VKGNVNSRRTSEDGMEGGEDGEMKGKERGGKGEVEKKKRKKQGKGKKGKGEKKPMDFKSRYSDCGDSC